MATRIAWLLNLDADLELQDPAGYAAARLSAQRIDELSTRVTDLIAPDDVLLDRQSLGYLPGQALPDTSIQAFCPTPSALARILALGLPAPAAPSLDVLRRVNDRRFCAKLGHGLPDACFALDMPTLEEHVTRSPGTTYVIKRAFSFAGREQRRATRGLDASTRGFCLRSFSRGEGVQVEPWVERLADFSKHGYLTRSGALLLGATREQLCDPMGRFISVSTAPAGTTELEEELLTAALTQTASALSAAGYSGAFGIDAFRYAGQHGKHGPLAFNPRCEINARFTMGYPRELLLRAIAADD